MAINLIVQQAKQGNALAKATLYEQYAKPLYNLCIKLLGNIHDAEDVLQEGFIQAFDKLQQLQQNDLFGPWLKKIMVNKCFVQLRKAKANWQIVPLIDDVDVADEIDYTGLNISATQINDAIVKLPNGCRQIVVLYLLENYTHKAIAEELGIAESTSKSQYQYGKKLLKTSLQHIITKNEY